jgi:hypothetical protein
MGTMGNKDKQAYMFDVVKEDWQLEHTDHSSHQLMVLLMIDDICR